MYWPVTVRRNCGLTPPSFASQSGKTKQIYKGHTGPVTSLAFYTTPSTPASDSAPANVKASREVLLSGSWDKSVRVWDTLVRPATATRALAPT